MPVDDDTEVLPVAAPDVEGFITKSLDEVDIFGYIEKFVKNTIKNDKKQTKFDESRFDRKKEIGLRVINVIFLKPSKFCSEMPDAR